MAEAGVSVIGGHSIKDPEIKAGFAVTGVVDPSRVTLRAGARPGDVLILTKPLGTGIIAFAAQIDRAPPGSMEAAARSMAALNKTAAELMLELGAHGCTDVTGFGLMGHLAEMAAGSGVNVEVVWDDLPLLPGVLECAAAGIIPGSVERNRESCAAAVTCGRGVTPAMLDVCMDAQTFGRPAHRDCQGEGPAAPPAAARERRGRSGRHRQGPRQGRRPRLLDDARHDGR